MTFTVSDLLADETVASGDAEHVKMLDNVAGSLFCTGVKMNGEYIWKSVEQTTQGLTMYLWFSSSTGNSSAGWFLSASFDDNKSYAFTKQIASLSCNGLRDQYGKWNWPGTLQPS